MLAQVSGATYETRGGRGKDDTGKPVQVTLRLQPAIAKGAAAYLAHARGYSGHLEVQVRFRSGTGGLTLHVDARCYRAWQGVVPER